MAKQTTSQKPARFIRKDYQGRIGAINYDIEIIIDIATGVNYMFCTKNTGCGSPVPMYNPDGSLIISTRDEIKELIELRDEDAKKSQYYYDLDAFN